MVFKKYIIRLVFYKVILEDDKQQMIRIAICDDEKRFCLELEKYILKYEFINDIEIEIKKFYTGEDLIEFIKKEEIDLLFLDIELVKMNGISVGEYIRDTLENYKTEIVYFSSKDSYDRQLFKINPFDFLEKPIDIDKLNSIIKKFIKITGKKEEVYTYKKNKTICSIPYDEIMYLESEGRHIIIIKNGEVYDVFNGKIGDEKEKFITRNFVNPHKSYIVNLKFIVKISASKIELKNGLIINIGRKYVDETMQKYMAYRRG
ncbi:MAG: response regulator transcription factor [Peptostreptococcus sp.]|nr:response regulator transcription factor [Peptostreptococcus sp.]